MSQLRGMPADSAEAVVLDLGRCSGSFSCDDSARALLIRAELFRVGGDTDNALNALEQAVRLSSNLSPRMMKFGVLPEVWFTRSLTCVAAGRLEEARTCLQEITPDLLKMMTKSEQSDFEFRKN